MKLTATTLALAGTAMAGPKSIRQDAGGCDAPVELDATTNIWEQYTLHANNYYRSEIELAMEDMSEDLAAQAAQVADTGSFVWVDTRDALTRLEAAVEGVPCDEVLGVVVYDLPGRDCAAKASNGELKVGEIDIYKTEFIDPIAEILKSKPNTAFALVIEPDSLPNLITNIDLQTCQDSAEGYREGVAYAISTLNLPNVVMYLDAGHGGWLGWDDNLEPGAEELAAVYKQGGSPSQFRGIATNVAGWNSYDMEPGEFADATDAEWNQCQNEKTFVEIFGAALESAGMPNHAIVDTGRNAVQGIREEWGHWCNVDGAGFGVRPTTDTDSELVDALVWVKPGGESDGTSDTSADRFDDFCGYSDAYQPSPEAGFWHQDYFIMLLENADPPFN